MADKTTAPFVGPIRVRLFGLTIVLLLLSLLAVSFDALRQFEQDLVPEMDKKAVAVGQSLSSQITRGLNYGIPLDKLRGTEEFLDVAQKSHAEIKYLAITDKAGKVLFGVGESPAGLTEHLGRVAGEGFPSGESQRLDKLLLSSVPLKSAEAGIVGGLHVGVDQKFVQKKLEDIIYDVLIVLLVSLLITFELLLFLMTANISRPMESVHMLMSRVEVGDFRQNLAHDSRDEVGRFITTLNSLINEVNSHYRQMQEKVAEFWSRSGPEATEYRKRLGAHISQLLNRVHFAKDGSPEVVREKSLVDVRTPMFIFIFAEELSRSFFPLYVSDLYAPVPGLTQEMVIGLPISLFMLFVAIGTPFAGAWTDRFGSRKIFLTGAVLAIAGFIGTGLAPNLYHLLGWRCMTAVAYALITMACQGYIVAMTTAENRAQGMAVFIGAIMVAAICGTSIGGVLADRLGFRFTFFLSAGLALVSAIFVHNTFARKTTDASEARPGLKLGHFLALFGNFRFAALMILGAIPAKLILTGFLFYWLNSQNEGMASSSPPRGRLLAMAGRRVR